MRNSDDPTVQLSIEATEFIHEQAARLVEQQRQSDLSRRQRILQKLSGRLGMLASIRDETAAALEATQNMSDSGAGLAHETQSSAATTPDSELPSALDPISLAMRARAARQKRHSEATAHQSSHLTSSKVAKGPNGDIMAQLGIY